MKNFMPALLISLMFVFTRPAYASIANTYKAISSNEQLLTTLKSMGFKSAKEASLAFEKATIQAKAMNMDENSGTIAICSEVETAFMIGGKGLICSTLYNAYAIYQGEQGMSAFVGAGVNAAFIQFKNSKADKHCFFGGGLAYGQGPYFGLDFGAEYDCDAGVEPEWAYPNKFIDGWFVALRGGLGVGAKLDYHWIWVNKIVSYWE